jgi:hypothetical protein
MTAMQGEREAFAGARSLAAWSLITLNVLVLVLVVIVGGGFKDVAAVLVLASFVGVGGLLTIKRPGNAEAWLVLAVGSTWSLAVLTPFSGSWVPPLGLMGTQLLLRFPNGHLPARKWRWFSRASLVEIVVLTVVVTCSDPLTNSGGPNPYHVAWTERLGFLVLLLPVFIAVSAGSLLGRYRRAGVVEREQIRWLLWAAGCVTLLYSTALVASSRSTWGPGEGVLLTLLQTVALLSFILLPVAIGIAVLKHHLYDIDRVISRTTSYAIVTGGLLSAYGVVVTLASLILPHDSSLAVAAATLVAAALFRPLLRRVQSMVDRRFDRARYDANRTVDAFGNRLRDEVDTDRIRDDLVTVVRSALQPDAVAIWLQEPT